MGPICSDPDKINQGTYKPRKMLHKIYTIRFSNRPVKCESHGLGFLNQKKSCLLFDPRLTLIAFRTTGPSILLFHNKFTTRVCLKKCILKFNKPHHQWQNLHNSCPYKKGKQSPQSEEDSPFQTCFTTHLQRVVQ